jgi:hypothetical protein
VEDKSENINLAEKKDEDEQDFELPFFNLSTIIDATNDFSDDNKLGEGGFGPVYKVNIYNNLVIIDEKTLESHFLTIFSYYKI